MTTHVTTRSTSRRKLGRTLLVLVLGMTTLAACNFGGGPGPDPIVCDGDTGNVAGNDSRATATAAPIADVRTCNDKTNGTTDVDWFSLTPSGAGSLHIECPTPGGTAPLFVGQVNLYDAAGTIIAVRNCFAQAATPIDVGVSASPYYLEVFHADGSVEATIGVSIALDGGQDTDPRAITLGQIVTGTVGPGDTTDTITFTTPATGQLRILEGCADSVPYTITGLFAGNPNPLAQDCIGNPEIPSVNIAFDNSTAASIVVTAPAGATAPVAYRFTVGV